MIMLLERGYEVIEKGLKKLDPELAHDIAVESMELISKSDISLKLLERIFNVTESSRLRVKIASIEFANPLLLASGFDKEAVAYKALNRMGFSSVETGTVVRFCQKGNDKPRITRLPNGSIFNQMGFPSKGVESFMRNIKEKEGKFPIGVSLGVNKDRLDFFEEDLYFLASSLVEHSDYLVVNVSSPNTEGLRSLLFGQKIRRCIGAVKSAMNDSEIRKPLFIKISPDLEISELDEVILSCVDEGVDGVIATNTTSNDVIKGEFGIESKLGGISGKALRDLANKTIAHIYSQTGDQLPIIGSGGVFDYRDLIEKLKLGAKAVSVYTAFVNEGPYWPSKLLEDLDKYLEENRIDSVSQLVGRND